MGGQNTSSEAQYGGSKTVTSGEKGAGVMMKWTLLAEQICFLSQAAFICFCAIGPIV